MKTDSADIKQAVLQRIAGGSSPEPCGNAKFRVCGRVVHARFCSESDTVPHKYKFNINPNTLSADYELWICGGPDNYYLLPISVVKEIYEHPDAYVDGHHPEIRVVGVDVGTHRVTYARGGLAFEISSCLKAVLKEGG